MLKDIRRIEVDITVSEDENQTECNSLDITLSVLYDSRDFSEEDIHSIIDANINDVVYGDMSNIDDRILILDSNNIDILSKFLRNAFREENIDSNDESLL